MMTCLEGKAVLKGLFFRTGSSCTISMMLSDILALRDKSPQGPQKEATVFTCLKLTLKILLASVHFKWQMLQYRLLL